MISLVKNGKEIVRGKWGKSGILLLLPDYTGYALRETSDAGDPCAAAFVRRGREAVVVKLHSSLNLGNGESYAKAVKNGDKIQLGLGTYEVRLKGKSFRTPLLIAILISLGLAGLGAKLVTSKRPVGPALPVATNTAADTTNSAWETSRLLAEARIFIAQGDTAQARMSIEQALRLDPNNQEGHDLLASLEAPAASTMNEEGRKLVEEGETLLKLAQEQVTNGLFPEAYLTYRTLSALFKDSEAKPPYYTSIQEGLSETRRKLDEKFSGEINKADELIASAGNLASAAARSSLYQQAVQILKGVLNTWSESNAAMDLIQKAYKALDDVAVQYVMKADTLRQIASCAEAVKEYRLAKDIAKFEEVPAYQRAELGLQQCE